MKAKVYVRHPQRSRKTRFSDMPGGGVCWCLNPAGPVCADCPHPPAAVVEHRPEKVPS